MPPLQNGYRKVLVLYVYIVMVKNYSYLSGYTSPKSLQE